MNKLVMALSLLISFPVFAGLQGSRTIYDIIGITNDTNSNVLINGDRILTPGQEMNVAQEHLNKQTKRLIHMYIANKQQTVTFAYYTYGQGLIAERLDGIHVKVSELLKKKNEQTIVKQLINKLNAIKSKLH